MFTAIHDGIKLALDIFENYPKKILVNPNTKLGEVIGNKFFGIEVELSILTDDITLIM